MMQKEQPKAEPSLAISRNEMLLTFKTVIEIHHMKIFD
jgi:hypothetical protein